MKDFTDKKGVHGDRIVPLNAAGTTDIYELAYNCR